MEKSKRPKQFFEIFPGSLMLSEGYPNPKKGRKPKKNKLKENIKATIPVLFKYVPENDPDWEKFNQLFIKKISARLEDEDRDNQLVEACLYDVVLAARSHKEEAIILLQFFEVMLSELLTHVTVAELAMLRETMKNMLVSLDCRYLNFVGEMAALNAMMKSGKYRIEALECKLPDSSSKIDFKLRKITDNSFFWVEILNLHPDGDRLELKKDKVAHFFINRYEKKLASKKTKVLFHLIPVIWIDRHTLKIISDYFYQHPINHQCVSEPMAYVHFRVRGKENEICHRFGAVSELYDHTRDFFKAEFE